MIVGKEMIVQTIDTQSTQMAHSNFKEERAAPTDSQSVDQEDGDVDVTDKRQRRNRSRKSSHLIKR